MSASDEARTRDVISDALVIWQHAHGYRYGLDALLLATALIPLEAGARVVELGAGQGAVSLCVAARHPHVSVLAVERNPSLLGLLRDNILENEALLGGRVEALECDLREHRGQLAPHSAALVLCNPPYFPQGQRRQSACVERADAHHERHGTLADFLKAAAYVLSHQGSCKLVLPPWRLAGLFDSVRGLDLKVERLRGVYASASARSAYVMEVWLKRGRVRELSVESSLVVRDEAGAYTPEVSARIAGAARAEVSPCGE